MRIVEIGDTYLGLKQVNCLLDSEAQLALSVSARERIARARIIVERYAGGDEPVYGLNTGLGGNLGFRLEKRAIEEFQAQLVLGRNIGVGEALPARACRAALLIRIVGLSRGNSGISQATADLLVAMFNAGVIPVIPARGSIGAGDLGLSAHMAAVLIGRGHAWFRGAISEGGAALELAGLHPVVLQPKDGLALCNHSSPSAGLATVALADLGLTLSFACAVAALAFEGYGANPRIFDARLADLRPAHGQREAAALFRALLDGSSLHDGPRSIQDALSFRCLAPIFGTMLHAFGHAREALEIEINSAADNPAVLIEDGLMVSVANFHTPTIALAMDTLAIGMTHLASASAQRIIKLMNPAVSGLPRYLSPVGGASAGYVPLQKTMAALHAEIRLAATPASLDALPVSDGVEDHAPQTMLTVRKLAGQLEAFRLLVALEAVIAAQAVDLRQSERLSAATQRLFNSIREKVPMLRDDRETGHDVMAALEVMENATLARQLFPDGVPFG